MNTLLTIASACSAVVTIAALVVAIFKPFKKILKFYKADNEVMLCLLRANILNTYRLFKADKKIPQVERQNIDLEYQAYKSRNGNTFIDDVYSEIREWEIV